MSHRADRARAHAITAGKMIVATLAVGIIIITGIVRFTTHHYPADITVTPEPTDDQRQRLTGTVEPTTSSRSGDR